MITPEPKLALRGPVHRHPALTITLHWLSALAVFVALGVAWTRAALDDPAPRAWLMSVHQGAGVLVLALLLARVGTRLAVRRDAAAQPLPRLMQFAAHATHGVLYAVLLALPLLGWALANAHGHDVRLPGLATLPSLVPADPDLAESIEAWHVGLAWLLSGVIVLHAGAALFHHLVRRDAVLLSMLPPATAPRAVPRGPAQPRHAQPSRTF